MDNFLAINKALVVLVEMVLLGLGFWVYLSSRRDKTNRIFFLLAISTALWIALYFLVTSSSQLATATFFAKLGHAAVSIFYIPFYLFFIYFLNLERKFKGVTIII